MRRFDPGKDYDDDVKKDAMRVVSEAVDMIHGEAERHVSKTKYGGQKFHEVDDCIQYSHDVAQETEFRLDNLAAKLAALSRSIPTRVRT
jgi:hypothetical protein